MRANQSRVSLLAPITAESPASQDTPAPLALRPTPVAGLAVGHGHDRPEGRADVMTETSLARLQRLSIRDDGSVRRAAAPVAISGGRIELSSGPSASVVRRTLLVNKFRGDKPMYIDNNTRARSAWKDTQAGKDNPKVTDDDVDKAFARLGVEAPNKTNATDPNKTYDSKAAFGEAMLTELTLLGADLGKVGWIPPAKPTKTQAQAQPSSPKAAVVRVVERPVETTGPILWTAMEKNGPDTELVDLTRAELLVLSEHPRSNRVERYVAGKAAKYLKKAQAEAADVTPTSGVTPVVTLTLEMIKHGQQAYKDDKSIDKTPELGPRHPDVKALSTSALTALLPTILAEDKPTFEAMDALLNDRITTELTQALALELTSAFILLNTHWMALKPKARLALTEMIKKAKEFGGMRGVVGEANAAWYAAAIGRTEVSVSNDKSFGDPDNRGAVHRPGIEFQDVDVASNTADERFFTEAKYDMGTFLSKASETVKQGEDRAEKKREKLETKRLQAPSSTRFQPLPALPPRTTGPEANAPAQLHRYEKAATRPKARQLKKQRDKRLEVYIANRKDWLGLFDGHDKLRSHLQDKRWRVVVETYDVMSDPKKAATRFQVLRENVHRTHLLTSKDWLDFAPWREALSAAVTPADFFDLSEEKLEAISAEVFETVRPK